MHEMTRYLVFKFSSYDEEGGWNDFASAHEDLNEAIASAERREDGNNKSQIVDLLTFKIIETRTLWEDSSLMVTDAELKRLQDQRDEFIAARQRARGLIA